MTGGPWNYGELPQSVSGLGPLEFYGIKAVQPVVIAIAIVIITLPFLPTVSGDEVVSLIKKGTKSKNLRIIDMLHVRNSFPVLVRRSGIVMTVFVWLLVLFRLRPRALKLAKLPALPGQAKFAVHSMDCAVQRRTSCPVHLCYAMKLNSSPH
jgi:hypothetical protein